MRPAAVPRPGPRARVRVRIEGTVQGVGFRPHVAREARALGLAGFVRNDARGVVLEAEGAPEALERLLVRVREAAPPAARLERLRRRALAPRGEEGAFRIAPSRTRGAARASLAPDLAPCADCLRELADPGDRRHRHPFVSCTRCGPRLSIALALPYDRARTTMAAFEMCAPCAREYASPLDRRFHSQPNACPRCGPRLRLTDAAGGSLARDDAALRAAGRALGAGRILALKGVGGFHLACRADDPRAVARLRRRKRRPRKPFALMARDRAAAAALVRLGAADAALLEAPDAPIVLAPRRAAARIAPQVAPGLADLGVMLPATPLHQLLLEAAPGPLVMTSGNRGGAPTAHRDEEALAELGGIADLFLLHDRPIAVRCDDSVVRTTRAGPLTLRRARGRALQSLALPVRAPRPLLACGADLKSAPCLAAGRRAWPLPHVGDLGDAATFDAFRQGIAQMTELLQLRPRVVVHDLHPDYHATRFAESLPGVRRLAVQHHHAHLCAVLAEHGSCGPAVGALFDGTGYGADGSVWGGELLVGGLGGYQRAGHLLPVPMPGGERAVREPWRMACAWSCRGGADRDAAAQPPPALRPHVSGARWRAVAALVRRGGRASPRTTSVGRLFDAAAALAGVCPEASYEGQAAMELEAAALLAMEEGARPAEALAQCGGAAAYRVLLRRGAAPDGGEGADEPAGMPRPAPLVLDPRPALRALAGDTARGVPLGVRSARFHLGLADATARACGALARARGLEQVVLSGGVFQNRILLEATSDRLRAAGLRVLVPRALPPGDGAIAFGQAAAAAFALAADPKAGEPPWP